MPQQLNPFLESEFTQYIRDRMKTQCLKCKHCTYDAVKNNFRALEHFAACKRYQETKRAREEANESDSPQKQQRTLATNLARMPAHLKKQLDVDGAMAVYMGARPFRLYEDQYMKTFI